MNEIKFVEKCYRLYEQKMFQVAYSILRDEDSAEDAVQEAFLKLMKSKRCFDDVFTDYFLYLFTGIPELVVHDFFTIPFFWLGVMILPFFSIGYYAVDDLIAYGIQMIVKSRSKLFWWISKCIWCALSVLVYIAV